MKEISFTILELALIFINQVLLLISILLYQKSRILGKNKNIESKFIEKSVGYLSNKK